MEEQLLFRVDEAARRLHISQQQLYNLIRDQKVNVVRFGPRTMRIHRAELERIEREGAK